MEMQHQRLIKSLCKRAPVARGPGEVAVLLSDMPFDWAGRSAERPSLGSETTLRFGSYEQFPGATDLSRFIDKRYNRLQWRIRLAGLGHLPLKEEIEGSNPSCATRLLLASIRSAYPSFPSDHNLSSPTIGQRHPLKGAPSFLLPGIAPATFARLTCPTTVSRLRLES